MSRGVDHGQGLSSQVGYISPAAVRRNVYPNRQNPHGHSGDNPIGLSVYNRYSVVTEVDHKDLSLGAPYLVEGRDSYAIRLIPYLNCGNKLVSRSVNHGNGVSAEVGDVDPAAVC